MKQTEVVFSDMLIADQNSAVVLKPGIQTLDLSASGVSSQLAAILCNRSYSVGLMWSDRFNAFGS
jgi:hypothetical protein